MGFLAVDISIALTPVILSELRSSFYSVRRGNFTGVTTTLPLLIDVYCGRSIALVAKNDLLERQAGLRCFGERSIPRRKK